MARVRTEPEPLTNYTTAQQLGALRRELIAEGFTEAEAGQIAHSAFRTEVGFAVRIDNIHGEPISAHLEDESPASV